MAMTKKDLKMRKLQEEAEAKRMLDLYLNSGHKMPTSRREFLSAGLISMSSFLMMPTLAQLLAQSAWAAEDVVCPAGNAANAFPAYIHLQVGGGGALFANHIPTGPNGAALPNYGLLGMGGAPRVELMFANQAPFWVDPDNSAASSEIMRGLFRNIPNNASNANYDIYQKTAFVGVASESVDDRADNPQDISGMLFAAGIVGSTFPYLMAGSSLSSNFRGAIFNTTNLLNTGSAAALEGSLGLKGALGAPNLSLDQQQKLVKAIEDLNKRQVASIANDNESEESKKILRGLVKCSTEKNTSVVSSDSQVNIYGGTFPGAAALAQIWNRNFTTTAGFAGSTMNTVIERCGLAVSTCLRGMSGGVLINIGGYDYHIGASRNEANARDNFLGEIIGKILLSAKTLNRAVFLYVSTDGSLSSPNSSDPNVNWSGDTPRRGMGYILAYNPAGAPTTAGFSMNGYQDASYQLNHFSNSHVVNTSNPIASLDAQDLAAAAVFMNYLNFANKPNLIDSPALAQVKNRLIAARPTGAGTGNDFSYYTRIKAAG